MGDIRKSYRIRTGVGNEAPNAINVNLMQTFDTIEVLSLEIKQKNFYKMPSSGYGVIVGRVMANNGFGIPNAKVSVFIPYERNSLVENEDFLYHYVSTQSKGEDGIRYNLLPRHLDEKCHQNIGSMYEKEYLLDNNDIIQVFEKYYKYTAVTNNSGDYFIYGVPVGVQTLHVDLDLSDIGVLSQRPRDMVYKGYSLDMFENPNKFKKNKNLDSLPQVYSQDNVVTVYPFWGDTTVDQTNGVITRCDVNIAYTFEPTCVFIGSIISDTGSRAISQRCVPDDEIGKMSELVAGEGKIEMIRKTFDGKVEEFSIKGNNLIDSDGVWCYQIPMNLDYVATDEFGNIVPTDDPNKGIPTRTRVRFRISMNETETDETARKRARFLVPNNPKLNADYPDFSKTHMADYEFGTFTKDESYRDLFWNKVYTVKSYIPRLQKAKALRRRVHTGIKNTNHAGGNNPFPFNNLFIRLTFAYRFLCSLMAIFCGVIYVLNTIFSSLAVVNFYLGKFFANFGKLDDGEGNWVFKILFPTGGVLIQTIDLTAYFLLRTAEKMVVKLPNFCEDGNFEQATYVPGAIDKWISIMQNFNNGTEEPITIVSDALYPIIFDNTYQFPTDTQQNYDSDLSKLFNCIENQLAQDQECTSFNFTNDWVNGVLYAPLWFRKVKSKKRILFGLVNIKAKDLWCSGNSERFARRLSLCQTCAQKREINQEKTRISALEFKQVNTGNFIPQGIDNESTCYGYKCHKKSVSFINVNKGLIMQVETMLGENVYYYKSVEYDGTKLYAQEGNGNGDVKTLFATDIVLLGSLNECDVDGVPQFFKRLEGTTYNMPPDLVQLGYESDVEKLEFEEKPEDKSLLESFIKMNIGDFGMSETEDDIYENNAILDKNTIHTEKSGADWGNYGRDQVKTDFVTDDTSYIFTSKKRGAFEWPDVGGLFYGLTCWSSYTKPKSCINLSRICEYGVSLDESDEHPIYTNTSNNGELDYKISAPDGFISYDELYDMDGRAMFATMNGNNLKTVINPKNGFPIYDFKYLYPENFDGSLSNIMYADGTNPSEFPIDNNYKAEISSDAYLRFRYGRNWEDRKIEYYHSNEKLGMYRLYTLNDKDAMENKNRFPKYENSFYFYFGLKPGSTAIDKFRTLYYSECSDNGDEKSVINIEYQPNSWCSEVAENGGFIPGDGYLKIDATYLDTPYDVYIDNMDGETMYDIWCKNISKPKIYVSNSEVEDMEEGFERQIFYRVNNGVQEEYALVNGVYRITIIDANGVTYKQHIDYITPFITANISTVPFRLENSELPIDMAYIGGLGNETMSDRNEYGGFIEVTNVMQESEEDIDFKIDIEPMFDSVEYGVQYYGSHFELLQDTTQQYGVSLVRDDTLINENFENIPPYCPYGYDLPGYPDTQLTPNDKVKTNGGKYDFRFGTPLGGKDYVVSIVMLCKNSYGQYHETRNKLVVKVTVLSPIDYEMLINGVDYSIIRRFGEGVEESNIIRYGTGWYLSQNEMFPNDYVTDFDYNKLIGWDDIDNVDDLTLLDTIPENDPTPVTHNWNNYIRVTEEKLTNTFVGATTPYCWERQYKFDTSVIQSRIGKYSVIPEVKQGGVGIIYVLTNNQYVCYVWDDINNQYIQYERPGEPGVTVYHATTEDYYDTSDVQVKNEYIAELNHVTQLRYNFIASVKNAFYVRTAPTDFDSSITMEIGFRTGETPVKTLLYYNPDENQSFVELDERKEQSSCYGIMNSTITGLLFNDNDNEFIWDGVNLPTLGTLSFQKITDDYYKKPYLVAIQNGIDKTLPKNIEQNGYSIYSPINDIARYLFGVHLINKRLRVLYNTWAPIVEVPFFNEGETIVPGTLENINIPGLFAGFVLDGEPEVFEENNNTYPGTNFIEQTIENKEFNINTFTVVNGELDEDRIPVVRFISSKEPDSEVYSDYVYFDTDFDNALDSSFNMKKHVCFTHNNALLRLRDSYSELILPLYGDVTPPIVTYIAPSDNTNISYIAEAEFESGWCYTFYDGLTNPIYSKIPSQCMNFVSPYITNKPNGTMFFNDAAFNFNQNNVYNETKIINNNDIYNITIDGNVFSQENYQVISSGNNRYPLTLVYCVKISNDRQRRVVSKTFDLTQMEYIVIRDQNTVLIKLNIGVADTHLHFGFYYLKNYTFSIEFLDESNNVFATATVNNGYYHDPNVTYDRDDINFVTCWANIPIKVFSIDTPNDEITEFENRLKDVTTHTYLTDITGLRKEISCVSGSVFNHAYILID